MKVLHVEAGRHLYGGALQVLYLIEGLAARGVSSVLVAPQDSAIAGAAASWAAVHPIAWRGDADVSVIRHILRAIRLHAPDIVHLHSRRGADLFGVLAARFARVPAVITRRVDNREPRWLVRTKYGLAARIVAISEGISRVLREEGVPAGRLVTVRSAVDTSAYAAACDSAAFRETLALPAGAITVGMVAQLIPRKGHRYLLDALPPLLQRYSALHVVLFGRGPLEPSLRRQADLPQYGGRVRMAGFRSDLPDLIGCLDLLVHPADMEGLGVSLLQASAAGVPVIASRAGGIPEAVRDGENGLLVPAGDCEALGAAIDRLLGDPQLRRRLGAAGRRVAEEFSIDAMVEGNLTVYRELLGRTSFRTGNP